jgi:hypothetical protein
VSASAVRYPYTFHIPQMQSRLTGGVTVGDKPAGYFSPPP